MVWCDVVWWWCGDGGAIRNNKERLKNNILIKIEFWDVEDIVKWYSIMIKWLFGMVK